ncbi:asparagine synthase (glutamine-hydrolyzing) [Metabacillus sp. KIGAM252]|uniref:asparagine synthase (glutamine-hydrolyzing) n=1 Tax=Metabacillus flavus TaxID=2823519 RepID=A0ABS5LCQ3_9BACI|nr:asparagine synthase (glutamine-hydrolyzing) [Metabacillus flavus]MBS2968313.1 asparagine synthase (glutamine-hydrolyzing) [Metabacillus flavus]
MCGITGWADQKNSLAGERSVVSAMTETLSKRGPDDTNLWWQPNIWFGHKRLTVVDPASGVQPMSKERDGKEYTICYNGELYNTEDIRKVLLSKGYTFRGHSDTEVLLASYMEWEENCLEYLNGIFAFGIWDTTKNRLFLARDRMGVKPLFYRYEDGSLQFGSELKAILAHPDVKASINREGLSEIMGLGPSRTPGHGVYEGIKELRPAHAIVYSRDGLKTWRYWNVKSKPHTDSFGETVEKVRFLLTDAVTRQLVSDVPLCTFLSGGLDSSAITAIAAESYKKEGKGRLHTFSIDYEENEKFFKANDFQPNSDGPWIQKMTDTFHTEHHRSVISQETLAHFLTEAVEVRDLPGMADIDSSLLWFCREIKSDFTVGLSGECADEIFGGYPWFHRPGESDVFPWMRSTAARTDLLNDKWKNKLNLAEYVKARFDETVAETPALEGESETDAKRRELFYLNMLWFMTTLLDRKDRMSMGASLEVRVPFADHRLVEYVWNIPWEMKMHGDREKGILRKALEGVLPEEVLYRKKSPYPKTYHPAYTKAVRNMLEESLKHKNSILHELFQREKLDRLIETNGSDFGTPWFGQLMSGPQLLAHLGQIHVWAERYRVNINV